MTHHSKLVSKCTAALALAAATAAQAATVSWAEFGAFKSGAPAPALVGAPDARMHSDDGTAAKFVTTVSYPALAATMGLSEAELMSYDVLAWEGNGGAAAASGGWESAFWVFRVGAHSESATFDELTGGSSNPALVFRTGSIGAADYLSLFGAAEAGTAVWSWLLVRLPEALDAQSPSFAIDFVRVGGAVGLGEGTPDPDAIGVLRAVPEPHVWVLLVTAVAGLRRWSSGPWSLR